MVVLKWTISLQMMNSELASQVPRELPSHYEVFWAEAYPNALCRSASTEKEIQGKTEFTARKLHRVHLLQEMWCYFFLRRTLVFYPIWLLLLKWRICTCGWNLNMMEMKWKAEIFFLGVILLLMWNLLSSTTSCSLYMCQVSDSLVSVLVFELFMCVATHTKCY